MAVTEVPSWPSPVWGAPRYAAHRAITGAATTVATTVVVTTRARSRSRRAAWSLGSSGYPARSKRGPAARERWAWAIATYTEGRGASTTGRATTGARAAPGQGPSASARSAARRQRGQSSTCRTSSRRRAAESSTWWSPVSRATVGQPAVSMTARAARVRSTSQAAPASSSRAVVGSRPSTTATERGASRWRTASSRASRCSGVVPAASGQASVASSRRRASAAGDSEGAGVAASSGVAGVVCSGVRRAVYAPWCRDGAEAWEPFRVSEALAVRGGLTVPEGRRWAWRPCPRSVRVRRQTQRASAYSQDLRSSSAVGPRASCRSAIDRTAPSASVAASWSQSTERQ